MTVICVPPLFARLVFRRLLQPVRWRLLLALSLAGVVASPFAAANPAAIKTEIARKEHGSAAVQLDGRDLLRVKGTAMVPSSSPPPRPPDIERASAEPANVRVQGDTVYYTGNFSKASSAAFDAAVAGLPRGTLTRLVISSGGGDTLAGRHIGAWVRDNALVVEVDVICFSSCANYVFPAGRARVIRADAFVGWHGNERQFEVLAARNGISLSEELGRFAPQTATPEQRTAFIQEILQSIAGTRQAEADFYASLGLSDAFAVCAVGDALERRPGYVDQKGWGFSLDDMARLGLKNTVYLGAGRYEQDSARFQQYLVPLGADDCLALLK
jgi:hypothetical protein